MSDREIIYKTAEEIGVLLEKGEVSSLEVATSFLKQAEKKDELGIYLHLDPEKIKDQARASDTRRKKGDSLGALDGVPISLKDNICEKDASTTCASKILSNFVSPYDSHVVERLRDAGAVLFGRTNMDEFAMGSSTENSSVKPTRNPWNAQCVPGGSSGGAAASVAASTVPLALGSDTGGSIRQPAAMCGIIGIKPTYGRVSRYGLVAFASSLDQIGTFGKTAADTALSLAAISGHDLRDSTSQALNKKQAIDSRPRPFAPKELKKLRIGLMMPETGTEGFDPEILAAVEKTASWLEAQGATVKPVQASLTKYAIPIYYILANAEASSNLGRYDGIRYGHRTDKAAKLPEVYTRSRTEGFGIEVKRRILLGAFVLSSGYYDAYYKSAQKARKALWNEYREIFRDTDLILQPTTPTVAFRMGEKSADPLSMYESDLLTISANLAGIPALSMPAGLNSDGLPLAIQFTASHFDENFLFRMAATVHKQISDFVPDYSTIGENHPSGVGGIDKKSS